MSVDVNGDGPQTAAMKLGTVPFERQGNIPCGIYPTVIIPFGGTVAATPGGTLAGFTYPSTVVTTPGTLAGLTYTRSVGTSEGELHATIIELETGENARGEKISLTLNIDDTDFSVTSSAGKDIAVGDVIRISGTNTGTGSITGYTSDKKYVVSSIDAGTAPLVTGFTLVDTDGTTAVVTTSGDLVGLTYTEYTGSVQPTVPFSTP